MLKQYWNTTMYRRPERNAQLIYLTPISIIAIEIMSHHIGMHRWSMVGHNITCFVDYYLLLFNSVHTRNYLLIVRPVFYKTLNQNIFSKIRHYLMCIMFANYITLPQLGDVFFSNLEFPHYRMAVHKPHKPMLTISCFPLFLTPRGPCIHAYDYIHSRE